MRKFAQVEKNTSKVVNIFDWSEEVEPNLGNNNLLIDVTNYKEEIYIGYVYNLDNKDFKKPVTEEVIKPIEEEKKPLKEELLDIIDELRKRIETL
jgi:hypothetical protein